MKPRVPEKDVLRTTAPLRLALVKVESILKGTVPNTVCVLTRHPDAERSFKVIVGRRYLFLLVQRQDCYDSVNGHFGVIPVDGKPD